MMKSSAILINTARGALIDSQALFNALNEGIIAAAAIDVLSEEPPINGNILLEYKGKNLIVTPHIAWATIEARQNAINQLADTIEAFQAGKKLNVLT
jgi:glycerate dehydrogenase